MPDLLSELLSERDWLLADGATGTTLIAMGLEAGEAPELWNVDKPEKIAALHQSFVDAGSDFILTNSFGGTCYRLKLHAAEDRVFELNKRAAELARVAADSADRKIVVAGSVGPTGELLEPLGALTYVEAIRAFRAQIEGLMAGGADIIWAETISSAEEMRAIAEAAAVLDAPFGGTMSFDTAGRTMMGVTAADYAALAQSLPVSPVAFGANCGTGAPDLLRTVLGMANAAPGAPIAAKGNAGIPKYVDGHIHYDGTPELMAEYAVMARDAGACIIGGCCGTRPEHLVAMRQALLERPAGPAPSLLDIEAKIGAFSSTGDGSGGAETAAPRRSRRRRR